MITSGLGNGSASGFALGTIGVRVAVGDCVNVIVGVGVLVCVLVGVLVVDVAVVVVLVLTLRGSGGGRVALVIVTRSFARVSGRFADSFEPWQAFMVRAIVSA